MADRYIVQSERYSGEPRAYYVVDLKRQPSKISTDFGRNTSRVSPFYETRREANAECRRLNEREAEHG